MSQRTFATNSDAIRQPSDSKAGVSLVPPGSGGQLTLETPTVRDVGPQFSEWLPDLHDALLPAITRITRELAFQYDQHILTDGRPRLFATEELQRKHGVGTSEGAHPFPDALAKYALSHFDVDPTDLSERKREIYEYARNEIVETGTRDVPGGPGGFEAVRETVIPLLDACQHVPTVVMFLDGPAWEDINDERTATRALIAIATYGEVCDLRLVCSPRLEKRIEYRHPDWYDEYLTEGRDRNHPPAPNETSETAFASAWNTVGEFTPGGGRLRLLAALSVDSEREVRDLKRDTEINLSDGAIDRYVRELADKHDLLDIDGRPKYNRVSLTETGLAAQGLIGPNHRVFHPEQSQFDDRLTVTRHGSTSIVCRSDTDDSPPHPIGSGGNKGGSEAAVASSSAQSASASSLAQSLPASAPSAEDWLKDTGEASENGYTQWLAGPNGRLDRWEMHERLLAGRRVKGVTFVDEPVKPLDDGRVSYVSCFEDHAQVVAQWGGPLTTLVRVTSALLSEEMWSKILTPSALGGDLEELYDGALDDAIQDVVRLGAQMGWVGEDQREYDGLRERYRQVRDLLLSKLPEATAGGNSTEWGELCKDAHGLLASATHLYHAIDVDVTIHIRVPNTGKLRAGENRYQGFCDFFKHTVPKNAVYGIHSVYRMLYESRIDKLKHRMGVEFDNTSTANLTASWVVSGSTASVFREDVKQAIASKASDVRESIQEGVERGVALEILVVEGNSFGALRRVVERHADRKGFSQPEDCERREIIRLSTATLGNEPGRCSPYALSEALMSVGRARSPTSVLTTSDVAYGLIQLPAERLVPSLPPTMQKALKALLTADEPLGASQIIERAGISERSYSRNIEELAAVGLVESVGNGGHRKWKAWIIPWWSPLANVDEPRTTDTDRETLAWPSRWDDVLYEIALGLGLDPNYELFVGPVVFNEVFDALPVLDQWRGFIETHYNLANTETTANRAVDTNVELSDSEYTVEIGLQPAGRDHEQASISADR